MTDQELTTLAREYAEEMHYGDNYFETENKRFLKWLTRRFCLVEKEKLKRVLALHIEKSNEVAKGGETWFFHKGSANTLRYLFPDLGKEVEG